MKNAYEKIVDVITDLEPIHINEDSDCDRNVYMVMMQEAKIKRIISILEEYKYIDKSPVRLS